MNTPSKPIDPILFDSSGSTAADSTPAVSGVDTLLSNLALPNHQVFYPLGFAVEVSTNHPDVLVAAAESWTGLRQVRTHAAIRLRIVVSASGTCNTLPTPVIHCQGPLLSINADACNHAICDLDHRLACIWISRSTLTDRSYLRYHFIEAAALILISATYATPLHAACVSRYGRGILLFGASGAGKSSLAYACARQGWLFTSDDASYLLQYDESPRVVGNCNQFRFRPSAVELFPELRGLPLTARAAGKPSIEVPSAQLPGILGAEGVSIHSVVFLNRQSHVLPCLTDISWPEARRRLLQDILPIEHIRDAQIASLDLLSHASCHELHYSLFEDAIQRLELLAQGARVNA